MKPFLIVTGDFVKTGGMDRANYAIADYLARQSVEVHLVAHRVDAELLAYPTVIWHRVPKLVRSYFLSGFLLDAVGKFWAKRITAQGGRVLVNGGNCCWDDINWVHYVHHAYQPTAKANRLQRLKVALTHQFFQHSEKQSLKRAKLVIANSARTKADLVQQGLVTTTPVQTIYYGIDSSIFYPARSEEIQSIRQRLNLPLKCPIAIFIGALGDRRKGFDILFEAWNQLCQNPEWDVQLLVVGQGAELSQWQQRNVSDRMQFLGFRSDVPDLLRASDCLIAPTRYEAYGLGVHEALCCGIPAIVSELAGVAERYPAELADLLLTNVNDVRQLMNRLYHWRSNQNYYQQIVQRRLTPSLQNEQWDHMAQQIVQSIQSPKTAQPRYSLL